jgi:hypothetical protein
VTRDPVLLAVTLLLAALSFWIARRNMGHSLWFDEAMTESDRAVWVVVQSLANEDSLAAKYTETGKRGLDEQTQTTLAALRGQGLSASLAAQFHRISVLLVRSGRDTMVGRTPSSAAGPLAGLPKPTGGSTP